MASITVVPRKNWYERKIEPRFGSKRAEPIRKLVYLLRNNGFNTTGSCGHDMWVEITFPRDKDVTDLKDLLIENGYIEFKITAMLEYRASFVFVERAMKLELLQNKDGKI